MFSRISCSSHGSVLTAAVAVAGVLGVSSLASAVIVYEPFNYPSVANGATMVGVTTNATGLTGSYSLGAGTYAAGATNSDMTYDTTGLSFGNLQTQGGSVMVTSTNNQRSSLTVQLNISPAANSTLYGSFIFNSSANTNPGYAVGGLLLGSQTQIDNNSTISILAEAYGQSNGFLNMPGITSTYGTGTTLSLNTTYMELFQVSGINGTSGSISASEWTLTPAQFANFQGNLTAAVLNAAPTGTAATDVTQMATLTDSSPSSYPDISSSNYLSLFSYNMTNQYDEVRLSTTSLSDVTPVPEPATLGLVAIGGLGLLLLKRRKAV